VVVSFVSITAFSLRAQTGGVSNFDGPYWIELVG
jgi:hypothetical protein